MCFCSISRDNKWLRDNPVQLKANNYIENTPYLINEAVKAAEASECIAADNSTT